MLDELFAALQFRNWYAVAAIGLYVLMILWKRLGLSKKIKDPYRWLPPALVAAATGFYAAFREGADWQTALLSALGGFATIGIPAMGIDSFIRHGEVLGIAAAVLRRLKKKPTPPAALLLCGGLAMGATSGCSAIKPVVRTADDAATILCQLEASKAPKSQLTGLSAKEWCALKENLQPFIDAVLTAQKAGAAKSGLAPSDE